MNEEIIKELLNSYDGELIDVCLYIYLNMKDQSYEQQVDCFQTLCEMYGTVKTNETTMIERVISNEELDVLIDQYGEYVNQVLNSLIKKSYREGYSTRQFYHNIWAAFVNGGVVTQDKEFAFAIYYTVIDRKIPYFVLEWGLKMNNQEFANCMYENREVIAKLRFILNHDFVQKTEEASLLIKEIIKLEKFEDQVIAMVAILSSLRNEQKRLKKLLNKVMDS